MMWKTVDIHGRFSVNCFSHHNHNTNLQSHMYEELYSIWPHTTYSSFTNKASVTRNVAKTEMVEKPPRNLLMCNNLLSVWRCLLCYKHEEVAIKSSVLCSFRATKFPFLKSFSRAVCGMWFFLPRKFSRDADGRGGDSEQRALKGKRQIKALAVLEWSTTQMCRAGHPICRKVLKIMFWEVPPADWLIL